VDLSLKRAYYGKGGSADDGLGHRSSHPAPVKKIRPVQTRFKYDNPRHRGLRASYGVLVRAGGMKCARCGLRIEPTESWDLGHDDLNPSLYSGPEHRKCNRATNGRGVLPEVWSRRW
jgi:hypothetical protein